MQEETQALAVGDWVSISVEMERWNLLIFQLGDVTAIKSFINSLPVILNQEPRQFINIDKANENGGCTIDLSVVGKNMKY